MKQEVNVTFFYGTVACYFIFNTLFYLVWPIRMLSFLFFAEYFGWINTNISCYCPFKDYWEWTTPQATSTSATLSADIILQKRTKNLKMLEIVWWRKVRGGNTVTFYFLSRLHRVLCKPSKSYFSITLVFMGIIFIFNSFEQNFLCWEYVMSYACMEA